MLLPARATLVKFCDSALLCAHCLFDNCAFFGSFTRCVTITSCWIDNAQFFNDKFRLSGNSVAFCVCKYYLYVYILVRAVKARDYHLVLYWACKSFVEILSFERRTQDRHHWNETNFFQVCTQYLVPWMRKTLLNHTHSLHSHQLSKANRFFVSFLLIHIRAGEKIA